jgi:hypothetical protein
MIEDMMRVELGNTFLARLERAVQSLSVIALSQHVLMPTCMTLVLTLMHFGM